MAELAEDPGPRPNPARWRRVRVAVTAAALMAAVGVPVGLALAPSSDAAHQSAPPTSVPSTTPTSAPAPTGPAVTKVLGALGTTTASGSFDFSYSLTETLPRAVSVTGSGIIDTGPMAMAASAQVSDFGPVGVRVDATTVWEVSAADNQVQPAAGDFTGSGQPLSDYAGLVEGTLGQAEGAVAMIGMASPTGYLDLDQAGVTGAEQVGTGTVDGTPVTEYQVAVDLAQLAASGAVSSEETTTIQAALGQLQALGYLGTEVTVSVDAAGYILQSESVSTLTGGTVTLDATFSDFGCAGTVGMPGQSGTPAPAGCTSPDQPTPSTTAPTSAGPPATVAPTDASPTSPVVPTTTVGPAPTTTAATGAPTTVPPTTVPLTTVADGSG